MSHTEILDKIRRQFVNHLGETTTWLHASTCSSRVFAPKPIDFDLDKQLKSSPN